jgi:hypothetical protein
MPPLEDTTRLKREYRRLTEERLPAAADQSWPVDTDHCFQRIVLDALFEDVWYDHVDGRPAHEHLSAAELQAAVGVADDLLREGRPLVEALNRDSLRWRGELDGA